MTDIVNKVNGREFSLMKVEELPCPILSLYLWESQETEVKGFV